MTKSIADYLGTERESAVTGSTLASYFGVDRRRIVEDVQRARLNGVPVIGCRNGYYISDDPDEIIRNAKRMDKQAGQLHKVSAAMKNMAETVRTGGKTENAGK